MTEPFVHITHLNLRHGRKPVFRDLTWTIRRGEHWLVRGASGSGKTSLAKAIAGLLPFTGSVERHYDDTSALPAKAYYVANWYQFKDLEGQSNFYYQQRYNRQATETTSTIRAELENFAAVHQLKLSDADPILRALNYEALRGSTLIQLSSGEHKKLQLIKALWLKPQLLVLDQPYNGLDKQSRRNLNALLDDMAAKGTQLVLFGNDLEWPSCINRFAEIDGGSIAEISEHEARESAGQVNHDIGRLPDFLRVSPSKMTPEFMIKMTGVNISYGDKQVLKDISWEVKAGEKWLLQGPNGSGKSTLLSLICGDHPQAYANNLYLFGHKRGSGESIWDIKQRIGLISPELHWYFDGSSTLGQSVVSGFYDSSGLFCTPGTSKLAQADELMRFFGILEHKHTLLAELPLGTQRLALLARTVIKNPELLILDEPCQGLDSQQTAYFNKLVDALCDHGTTLIYVGHFESHLPACIEKRIVLENGAVKSVGNLLAPVGA
ncbi:ATP-binding cassette domain-containing protein [Pedobacter faecalis]|uniref:ATP-binding cassette domain-containing protein n=1 Tax=Pedobacter faecalis TaxID=3041495 RepID=UPI00254E3AE5|nr:ATP-binding cassette domain-containing protein [Pedobacter sp. ELA7]